MRRGVRGDDVPDSEPVGGVEVSVVMTYLTLSSSATSGLYVFDYSPVFMFTQPDLDGAHIVSTLVYGGCMFVTAFGFALMTGSIGYAALSVFVCKLYSSVHIT